MLRRVIAALVCAGAGAVASAADAPQSPPPGGLAAAVQGFLPHDPHQAAAAARAGVALGAPQSSLGVDVARVLHDAARNAAARQTLCLYGLPCDTTLKETSVRGMLLVHARALSCSIRDGCHAYGWPCVCAIPSELRWSRPAPIRQRHRGLRGPPPPRCGRLLGDTTHTAHACRANRLPAAAQGARRVCTRARTPRAEWHAGVGE